MKNIVLALVGIFSTVAVAEGSSTGIKVVNLLPSEYSIVNVAADDSWLSFGVHIRDLTSGAGWIDEDVATFEIDLSDVVPGPFQVGGSVAGYRLTGVLEIQGTSRVLTIQQLAYRR